MTKAKKTVLIILSFILFSQTLTATAKINEIEIPEYNGFLVIKINGNLPFFTEEELRQAPFEHYSELDSLGRVGTATAMINPSIKPKIPRLKIQPIKPSGWNNKKYGFIKSGWVYNRCHLIAYCLTGENSNRLNLFTGTEQMNKQGMLPTELMVNNYINKTKKKVLYRATPVFENDNLICTGVLIEAQSISDNLIVACVFVYNVQKNVIINYKTGETKACQ